ncbi:type 8 capsular polysaccharide synthesis protein Cap8M [Ruthenibacterium sp. TH_2024_36131]|uniref:sugar transferase n=1 Tax=Owariibacterium komagatae TaxID=3136601 RepID=UPI0038B2FE8E
MCDMMDPNLENLIRKNQIVITKKQKAYLKMKRVLDFMCAFMALIILSPILVLVSIAIKIDSPHESIIFKQERIGKNGKPFILHKFRSMKQGTPELGTNEFMNAEQYITKVGKVIRKTSIDELPQLVDCVLGHMSLVGPRPLLAREDEMHYLRNYYGIYQIQPGITGLAQINGRDTVDGYDKIKWDREYVQNMSFTLDMRIIWRTVVKVLRCDGVVDSSDEKLKCSTSSLFEYRRPR